MTLDDLRAIEEIKQLKARYCRLIDSRQWDQLPDVFMPDATFEGFTIVSEVGDARDFTTALAKSLHSSVTVHHCHTPEILLLTQDKARGIWGMTDLVEWPTPRPLANCPSATGFRGYGFYEERYVRLGNVWRVAFMRLTRTRFDPWQESTRDRRHDPFQGMSAFLPPSKAWLTAGTH